MAEKYQPPAGPPPDYQAQQHTSHNPFRRHQPPSSRDAPPEYTAPPGAPPGFSEKKQAPGDEYAPPPGPPPSHGSKGDDLQPPPGPSPSHDEPAPPPYDPWMVVPDNAMLPPPPSFKQDTSPTANADYDDAARGHAWIRSNPLWQPRQHDQETLHREACGLQRLTAPPNAPNVSVSQRGHGHSHVRTTHKCQDSIFLSDIPVYAALNDSPLVTEREKTVYFEILVLSMGSNTPGSGDAGIAIGFVAPPYPAWRLPGWHRASLGVHGDDGRRYVDDSYGGKDFTHAFRKGETVGIGMRFEPPRFAGDKKPRCEVFFTRAGKVAGKWDLHEERDRSYEEGDVVGLEGEHDLLAAVGCFGGVEFDVKFRRSDWQYRFPGL